MSEPIPPGRRDRGERRRRGHVGLEVAAQRGGVLRVGISHALEGAIEEGLFDSEELGEPARAGPRERKREARVPVVHPDLAPEENEDA